MRKFLILFFTCFAFIMFGGMAVADPSNTGVSATELTNAEIVPGTILIPADVVETEEPPVEDEVPTSDIDGSPCPTSYADPEDYDPESNCEDPNEVVQTEEENQALTDDMCAEWNSPGHGSWALDPGVVDDEYTDSMNAACGSAPDVTAVEEPETLEPEIPDVEEPAVTEEAQPETVETP